MNTKTSHIGPLPSILVDACIIEEQPEHLVFAVRVPRDTLSRNHDLLAAISDRIADGPSRPMAARALPMIEGHAASWSARLRQWAGVLAVAGTAGIAFNAATHFPLHAATESPLRRYEAIAETPTVHPGGTLVTRTLMRRSRICETDVERVIITSDDIAVYSDRKSGIAAAVTDEPVWRKHRFHLPPEIGPGSYVFRSIAYSNCDGEHYRNPITDIPFKIAADS